MWYPVRVWAGAARLHAANVFINLRARAGQNQQPSCYIVFEGYLVYPSPDSGYLTKCTYGRMCRSIKWPAYALSILPETQTAGGFHGCETSGRSKTSIARRTGRACGAAYLGVRKQTL